MPMQRWMHSAAGGTSQRLKPAFATVCSRSRIPAPAPVMVPAVSAVAIRSSLRLPMRATPFAILLSSTRWDALWSIAAVQHVSQCARMQKAHSKIPTPALWSYARCWRAKWGGHRTRDSAPLRRRRIGSEAVPHVDRTKVVSFGFRKVSGYGKWRLYVRLTVLRGHGGRRRGHLFDD